MCDTHLSWVVAFHNYPSPFDSVGIALKSGWWWSGNSVSGIGIVVRKWRSVCGPGTIVPRASTSCAPSSALIEGVEFAADIVKVD